MCLQLIEGAVDIALVVVEEFLVGALGDDLAVLEDVDAVAVANGAEAVGDGDGGAIGGELVEGFLDLSFGDGVHGGGGFVHEEDVGIAEEGAGEGEALALTTGELHAVFAEEGVVALGEARDEVVGLGVAGGGFDLLVVDLVIEAVADVVPYGLVEDDGFLGDDADVAVPGGGLEVAEVDAVDEYLTFLWLKQAEEDVEEGGFAAAGGADEGDVFAAVDAQGDAGEDVRVAGVVAEAEVAAFDGVGEAGEGGVAIGLTDVRLGMEDFVDAVEAGDIGHEFVLHVVGFGDGGSDAADADEEDNDEGELHAEEAIGGEDDDGEGDGGEAVVDEFLQFGISDEVVLYAFLAGGELVKVGAMMGFVAEGFHEVVATKGVAE